MPKANYTFNSSTLIPSTSNHYLAYVSEHMIFESGLSGDAFKLWCFLRLQWKKHLANDSKPHAERNHLKAYWCDNAFLAENADIGAIKKVSKLIKELTEKGYLFSIERKGLPSYRVPLDPADNDYPLIMTKISKYQAACEKKEWTKPTWATETVKEEPKELQEVKRAPKPVEKLVDNSFKPDVFIRVITKELRAQNSPISFEHKPEDRIITCSYPANHPSLTTWNNGEKVKAAGYRIMSKVQYRQFKEAQAQSSAVLH